MKKLVKLILWILLIALIIVVTWFAWPRVPIITAFAAKGMCSSVFLAGKSPERVAAEDLSFFPISLAKCEIDYEEKSVTAKVFGLGKRKVVFREGLGAVIVLDKPEQEHEPGSYWNYSSGDANLLSGLLRNAIGDEDEYHAYAYTRLFHRIGMLNTVVETDASGLFVASSYSYGSTRDWARFGLLFLRDIIATLPG